MNLRPLRALKDLDRRLDELDAEDRAAEEMARFELARSASRYTRRTKKVVDETMSLSATMMRAGEVEEAGRLMEEVEREVRTEEAALIETVNEVKAAEAVRHRHLTKLRFLRGLATAFLSGGMFAISAFGMVAARHLTSDDPTVQSPTATDTDTELPGIDRTRSSILKEIRVAPGVKLTLTPFELKTFTKLTTEMDEKGLRAFLEDRLPLSMVDEIHSVLLTAAAQAIDEGAEEPMHFIVAAVRQQAAESSEEAAEPAGEPSPSEHPSDGSSAEPDENSPSPEPEPSPTDDKEEEDDPNVPLGWPLEDDEDG